GNITKFVRTYQGGAVESHTYTFDDKHDPNINVFGHDIMMLAALEGGKNNYLSCSITHEGITNNVTYLNTYNAEGYLIKSVATGFGDVTSTTAYFTN
ncbi:MAG: hypothetical protein V4581_06255, partial [Bacteroidota bacterium]